MSHQPVPGWRVAGLLLLPARSATVQACTGAQAWPSLQEAVGSGRHLGCGVCASSRWPSPR